MAQPTRQPYELLVRWRNGQITGAHVVWSIEARDGPNVIEVPQPPDPVNIGQGLGFPLAGILNQVQIDSLVAIADRDARLALKKTTADAALTAQIAAKDTLIAAKQAEIDELKRPERERRQAALRAQAAILLAQADSVV